METTPRTEGYDVIVVGARVAGASTAMLLARAGHRVALVDRVRMPADTLSTHLLAPAAHVQLRRWGLLDAVMGTGAPITREIQTSVDGISATFPLPEPASGVEAHCHPRRTVLDPLLVDAAEAAGADLFDGVTVTDLLRDDDGRAIGIRGRDGDGRPLVLSGAYVVAADGWRSRIARAVDAPTYDTHRVVNSTHYGYWAGLEDRGVEIWCSTEGLMAGVVPTNGGACVYLNGRPERIANVRHDLERLFRGYLAEVAPDLGQRLEDAVQTSPVRGTPGIPNFKRQPWGPGWVLVGDAGYTKDPISGHGITDAFVSAELAARAIHRCLVGEPEETALGEYHTRRDELAAHLYGTTLEWGSFAWTADELWGILARFGRGLTVEAQEVAELPWWEGLVSSGAARAAGLAFADLGEDDGVDLSGPGGREPDRWPRSRNGAPEHGQVEPVVVEH